MESLNLLDYIVVDEQGVQGEYSMGRTLNISLGGILMETHLKLKTGQQVMISIGHWILINTTEAAYKKL